jgi:AAA domain
MYIKRLRIENIRSIKLLDLQLPSNRLPGWHVILGDNGSGKSSVIRALALVLIGPEDAAATRQDWSRWLRYGANEANITASVTTDSEADQWTGSGKTSKHPAEPRVSLKRDAEGQSQIPVEIGFTGKYAQRTLWAGASGWFAASFGPFRRFSGGDKDYDRLYYSNPRLAPHLSAFGEDVALTEALRWLQQLQFRALEKNDDAIRIRDGVITFLNRSNLLPHGAKIDRVTSQEVLIIDANGAMVAVEQMSDGYRSILSLTFELLRGMTRSYGASTVLDAIDSKAGCINLPGVVAIDEVDAHLHPAWQKRIGSGSSNASPKFNSS